VTGAAKFMIDRMNHEKQLEAPDQRQRAFKFHNAQQDIISVTADRH
jgi:hypothetical protein